MGSSPIQVAIFLSGQIAQLVEQRTENPRVGGSIPSLATNLFRVLKQKYYTYNLICGNSSVDRAIPCQGIGRGFEPRFPLHSKHIRISYVFFVHFIKKFLVDAVDIIWYNVIVRK